MWSKEYAMSDRIPDCNSPRRQFLKLGTGLAGASLLTAAVPRVAAENCSPPIPTSPFNGSTCPFPIPWLDKNGSHNQMPKPGVELSNIFHFKGKIARCADFTGMGTDNQGTRIPFGAPSTDFSFMQGEYFAARKPQQGTFAHI
jgi:hypothetical protein